MKPAKRFALFLILIFSILISACGKNRQDATGDDAQLTPQPTEFPKLYAVFAEPYVHDALVEMVSDLPVVKIVKAEADADLHLSFNGVDGDIKWIYALAAPFYYIGSDVSSLELRSFWEGKDVPDFPVDQIFMNGDTSAVFEMLWDVPEPGRVRVVADSILLTKTAEHGSAFAILPFEEIAPAWQVLEVDGTSPIRKDFDPQTYALAASFSFVGGTGDLLGLQFRLAEKQIATAALTNRRAGALTTVITTGVTALVRDTAFIMENSGMTYPAIDIGDILREADILHINNEIPFTESCPKPFSNPYNDTNLIFCSKPEYIQLLEAIGTDVVELAGDHFWNWGNEGMYYTLDMYDKRGWPYYGGGRDYADALQPALFEHNGNKIAFLGCSAKPPGYQQMTGENLPGALPCDFGVMGRQIKEVLAEGYLPIFTFQHTEYYRYDIAPTLQADFRQVADAGAVIVQGSQAHHPHGLEFYGDAFLHYGLGNLFFDQYFESFETRQAFIDRHVFYNGRHINTELITIMFIDNARPRLMTADEREYLLTRVFTASGW